MKTKNFGEFIGEDIRSDQDIDAYGYDQILDIIQSNSPEEAAKIISDIIDEIQYIPGFE